jgi:site-specific DNA-methyltransferase (adenine-specific)
MGIKPYYQDPWVTIFNADCIEVLDAGGFEFAAVITDPPYSSGARQDAGKQSRGAMVRAKKWQAKWFSHDNLSTAGFLSLMRLLGSRLHQRAAKDASFHAFIDWRMFPNLYSAMESSGWNVRQMIVWDKMTMGMGNNYRNRHELILYADKGRVQFIRHDIPNVIRCARSACHYHPTQKPVDLLKKFIAACVRTDQAIFDPFGGSGSTLVAAKQAGRRAFAAEISEHYCEIAANRAAQDYICEF